MALELDVLRSANQSRLPEFKDKHGRIAHSEPDGSDWSPAQWLQAVMGELGEYAKIRKKYERGDIEHAEYAQLAADELADVQTYLDILAMRALDTRDGQADPNGINLSEATVSKFNRVSRRVESSVFISEHGQTYYNIYPDEIG